MARKTFSTKEKITILKEHFEKKISVADICEKHRAHLNRFYQWKKEFFKLYKQNVHPASVAAVHNKLFTGGKY